MSAVGTTLLHSPGWIEGKARNETLGTQGQKQNELRRSGTTTRAFALRLGSIAPLGLNKYIYNNKPRACALGYAGVSPRWGSSITTARNEYDVLTKVSTR